MSLNSAASPLLQALLEAEVLAKGDMEPKAGRWGLGMEGMVRSPPLILVLSGSLRGPSCWAGASENWWSAGLTANRCFLL